jgi:hypothetical protein
VNQSAVLGFRSLYSPEVLDCIFDMYIMRPLLRCRGFPAVPGEEERLKKLYEVLDEVWKVLHNLASLLLTNQTKRRGGNDL